MSNTTPSERDCQLPNGEFSPSQAFHDPETSRKATEILAQAKTPREKELVIAMLEDAAKKYVSNSPIRQKIESGLITSDLNDIIKEVSGKPRLQDVSPKSLPPTDT